MAKNTEPFRLYYKHEAIMRYARLLGFGEIHTKIDIETGLNAIIAIHSTKLGPAIGGTRCFRYTSSGPAVIDAIRLAYTMTLKAAVSDLPHGGAKAVLLKPRLIKDRQAYFRSYGDFVHEMNGQYITAVDVGTTEQDMDVIAERTPYVFGASSRHEKQADPSPFTAIGVIRGIQAAIEHKLNRDALDGIHVAIQGAGHVGYYLTKLLNQQGAKISICDPKSELVARCVDEFGAKAVATDKIYDVKCDVFSPCALSNIINFASLNRIQAPIIAGSANAQLAHRKYASVMQNKNILYAPDFVINSGGLIYAAMLYDYEDVDMANAKIDKIYNTLHQIFDRSASTKKNTAEIAEIMAKEKLNSKDVSHKELIG